MFSATTAAPMAPSGRRRQKSRTAAHHRVPCRCSAGTSAATSTGLTAMTSSPWSPCSPESDSRIEPGVRQIHEEVDDDEHEGHQQHERLGQRVVRGGGGINEEKTEAVEVEHLIG